MVGKSKDKALTPTERAELLKYLITDRDKVLFYVMAYGGLRVAEVEQLRLNWISKKELDDKEFLVIRIPSEDRNIKNRLKKWSTKTKSSREVYIFEKKAINEIYYFFKNHAHFDISARQIRNIVYSWGEKIGKQISPHALRATCQNYWKYEQDLKLEVISYMLGHSSIRTTAEFYDTRGEAQIETYLLNRLK